MTIDEAIEMYTSNAEYERTHGNLQGCLDFKQLVEWLRDYKRLKEQQSSVSENPNNCDLISRGEVLENAFKIYTHECGLLEVVGVATIETLPSIKLQEPKTGHWIIKDDKEQGYDIAGVKTWYIEIMCSECGFIKTAIEGHTWQYHYCPNCGARMESKQNG